MDKKTGTGPNPLIMSFSRAERTEITDLYSLARERLSRQASEQMRELAEVELKKLKEDKSWRRLCIVEGDDYNMEGEVGLYTFKTYKIVEKRESGDACVYNTRKLLAPQRGKQRTRTAGAQELYLLLGPSIRSNRESAELFARVRHQQDGSAATTLRDFTEKEGRDVEAAYEAKAKAILEAGPNVPPPVPPPPVISADDLAVAFDAAEIPKELRKEAAENPVPYPAAASTVNVTADAVFAKKQKEARTRKAETIKGQKPRKTVSSCTATVSTSGKGQVLLLARTYSILLTLVLATLKANTLTGLYVCLLTDGEKKLAETFMPGLKDTVGFVYQVLDWPHLVLHCAQDLSMAIKGKDLRNQYLKQLKAVLWHGCVASAISILSQIPGEHVKNRKRLDGLKEYLNSRKPQIPVYSVRAVLELANSSNAAEKTNDRLVSRRQKGKGMSWSQDGSSALANLRLLRCNSQLSMWIEQREVDLELKLAAA